MQIHWSPCFPVKKSISLEISRDKKNPWHICTYFPTFFMYHPKCTIVIIQCTCNIWNTNSCIKLKAVFISHESSHSSINSKKKFPLAKEENISKTIDLYICCLIFSFLRALCRILATWVQNWMGLHDAQTYNVKSWSLNSKNKQAFHLSSSGMYYRSRSRIAFGN